MRTVLLERPAQQRAAWQADAEALARIEVGGGKRGGMARQPTGRCHHGMALWGADRQGDHVARHQIGGADAQVEPLGHDVDQPPLGHQIDLHLRMLAQEFQHQRGDRLPALHRGVDAQHPRWGGAQGPHAVHRGADFGQGRGHARDEVTSGVGQGHAAGGAVEQAHAEVRLQPCDRMRQRGGGHAEVQRRRTKGSAARDGQHRLQSLQPGIHDCPDPVIRTCRIIPVISRAVEGHVRARPDRSMP
jgi:hypothetical protein